MASSDKWFPEDYSPNISTERWLELLDDKGITREESLITLKCLKDFGGEATCKQLSLKYGRHHQFYNLASSRLAKKVARSTGCPVPDRDNSNYAEQGLYSNSIDESEYNGSGEILWDRTISSVKPFFHDDIPFYIEFYTKRIIDDERSYVTRLHKRILTECSQILEEVDLLTLFDMSPLCLSDEPREHFGPNNHIVQRLRSELDIQFDSRKQDLLRSVIRFIEHGESSCAQPPHLYGTTTFGQVWEAVCAKGFGNQLRTPLKDLPLPSGQTASYSPNSALMELIKKPKWNLSGAKTFDGNGTLAPDAVALYRHGSETIFVIFDAKYYTYRTSPDRLPGIGDIGRQYLYQLAFKSFLNDYGISRVKNIFWL